MHGQRHLPSAHRRVSGACPVPWCTTAACHTGAWRCKRSQLAMTASSPSWRLPGLLFALLFALHSVQAARPGRTPRCVRELLEDLGRVPRAPSWTARSRTPGALAGMQRAWDGAIPVMPSGAPPPAAGRPLAAGRSCMQLATTAAAAPGRPLAAPPAASGGHPNSLNSSRRPGPPPAAPAVWLQPLAQPAAAAVDAAELGATVAPRV